MRRNDLRTLLALRYRLLWAHVRSRNGRIVLVAIGYLAAAFFAVLLALGGVGAAAASIRLGRSLLVAQVLLTAVFVNVSLGAVFLGLGTSPVFSDLTLRQYPLSGAGRIVARHGTALLEPLWLVVLALGLGLATGFIVSGLASPWLAFPAAVLFVATNYAFACIIGRLGAWILSMPAGPLLIIMVGSGLMTMAPLAPAVLARAAARRGGSLPGLPVLELTPPFAAAAAMVDATLLVALFGLLLLIAWSAGLVVLLAALDRLPLHSSVTVNARAEWDHPCDSIAAIFGSRRAPLAGKMLRYYGRSAVRLNLLLVLPALALMSRDADSLFMFALGVAPTVGFVATQPCP